MLRHARGRALRALLLTTAIAALGPVAVAQAAPVNQTQPTVSNGDNAVTVATPGQTLTCTDGAWDGDYDFTYKFKRDGSDIGGFSGDNPYTPQPGDVGHTITCTVKAEDPGDASTTDASSSNSVTIVPSPSVTVNVFSPAVSGNIGANTAGVSVTVSLRRFEIGGSIPVDVATLSTTTDANGAWSGNLANVGPATGPQRTPSDGFDRIVVDYGGSGTPPPDVTYQFDTDALDSAVASNGTSASAAQPGDCSDVKFTKNGGAPINTTPAGGRCEATFAPVLTDEDTLLVRRTTHPEGSNLTFVAPTPVLGGDSGTPRCSGDLVTGFVGCHNIGGGSYTLSRSRGPVSMNFTVDPGDDNGSAQFPGLAAGDVVTLRKQGGTRALTTLRLSTLRLDLVDGHVAAGNCEPRTWLPDAPGVCPANGLLTSAMNLCDCQADRQADEQSAGVATVDVPQFAFFAPMDGESVQSPFQAYVDVTDGTPTTLTMTPFNRNPDGSNGAQAGGPFTVNPVSGGAVSGLSPGRYNGRWDLSDTQGDGTTHDTNRSVTQFVVQPGGGAAQGTQGPQGPSGPGGPKGDKGDRGPAGRDATVKCRVTGKKRKPRVRCTVKLARKLSGRTRARLARGGRVYARGRTSGRRPLTLEGKRRIPHGTYTLTVVNSYRGHTRTVSARVVI
jgi:hypothetical protein